MGYYGTGWVLWNEDTAPFGMLGGIEKFVPIYIVYNQLSVL